MNLAEIQRRMLEAVMTPLDASERSRNYTRDGSAMQELAEEIIRPNDRLTSFERLEIYNRQYWFRIISGINEDFVGLRAVLGHHRFDALAQAYLTENPSQSFTLRNLGSRLESWLRTNPHWATPREALATDMVRLEWAEIEAFDRLEEPPLSLTDLQALDPDSTLRVQPYVQLLALSYPVDELLLSVRKREDQRQEETSNAIGEDRRRWRIPRVGRVKPQTVFLVVHRVDFSVYFKRLDAGAFTVLSALQDGKTIAQAIEIGFDVASTPDSEYTSTVQRWFADWALWGWFSRGASEQATTR
jgi:hypothetical protein